MEAMKTQDAPLAQENSSLLQGALQPVGQVQGLFYRRADGEEVLMSEGEQWLVTLRDGSGVQLCRFVDGKPSETYREMDDREGVIAVAGAILGFEPPRAPQRRDRQSR